MSLWPRGGGGGRACRERPARPGGGLRLGLGLPFPRRLSSRAVIRTLVIAFSAGLLAVAACSPAPGVSTSPDTKTSGSGVSGSGGSSREVRGRVGQDLEVGNAVITVRALQATFQPADPVQRLSGETPVAPAEGESFYQAFVRVLNKGIMPLRVDPLDFSLAVGPRVVTVEPTRSGPAARSLLEGASLDLLLTFKGPVGQPPELLYNPEWYEGTIRVSAGAQATTTSD